MNAVVQLAENHGAAECNPSIRLTKFDTVNAYSKFEMLVQWRQFVDALRNVESYAGKAQCPLIKLATFGEERSGRNSLRHDGNILQIFGLEGDYDGGTVSLQEAEHLLRNAGIEALFYTTPSCTADKPRWRVLAPLSRPVEPLDRKQFVEQLDHALGRILAKESYALSQCFYVGRVDRVKYEVRHVEGVCIDLLPSHAFSLTEGDLSIVGDTRQSDEELIRQILAAEEYHLPLVRLSARYHARGMSERVIVDKLHGIMRTNGDNSVRWQERFDDIKRIVRSAVQKFPVNPIGDIRHGSGDILPLTELGNADRLAAIVDSDAHYIHELDYWLHWDGAWFQDNGNSRMTSYARDVVQKLNHDASALTQAGRAADARQILTWSLRSQSRSVIDTSIELFSRLPHVRLSVTSLDASLLLVGFDRGRQVIDLKSGMARAARREDYVTRSLGIGTLGCSNEAVVWRKFLDDVFQSDAELILWFQRWCGYLLTGHTSEQCLLFLFGLGKNGKSVLANTLMAVLADYSRAVAGETLVSTKRDPQAASPELARLAGARLVTSVETDDGQKLAESLIKSMTGGDKITARHLHRESFEYVPTFKLMIVGNHKPLVSGTDHGIWRRIHLVPFLRTFSEEEADPRLTDKLRAELHNIAAWMVEGTLAWQRDGLGSPPKCVRDATLEYREQMDTIGEFLKEECESDPQAFVTSSSLFARYSSWCHECGLRPPSKQAFGRKLVERSGISQKKVNNERGYVGLRLSMPADNDWETMV